MAAQPDAVAVSVPEAAKMLGLGYVTCYRLLMTNELHSILVGKRRLVPITALHEFVERRLAAQAHEEEE